MGIIDSALERAACANCAYWLGFDDNPSGHCRRNSPCHIDDQRCAIWPQTFRSDWCGDHERA